MCLNVNSQIYSSNLPPQYHPLDQIIIKFSVKTGSLSADMSASVASNGNKNCQAFGSNSKYLIKNSRVILKQHFAVAYLQITLADDTRLISASAEGHGHIFRFIRDFLPASVW